jgi:hypothetical protein
MDNNGTNFQAMLMTIASDIINSFIYDTRGVKRVATHEALSLLTKHPYKGVAGEICPITFEELLPDTLVTTLNCGHTFSADAIYHWLKTEKSECPVCRTAIASQEVSNTNIFNSIGRLDIATAYTLTPVQNLLSVHPYGLDSTDRLATVICQDDDASDIREALNIVFQNIHRVF